MKELSGVKYTESEIIQAKIADTLSWIAWSKTQDAQHGRNKPAYLVEQMLGIKEEKEFSHDVFNSKEEFLKAREKALKR